MPIAIYRHMKLSVASRVNGVAALNDASTRRLVGTHVDIVGNGVVVSLDFTQYISRKQGGLYRNTKWEFKDGLVRVFTTYNRESVQSNESVELVPPLSSMAWSENRSALDLFASFECKSTRSIIELYLHEMEVDPLNYEIVVFDFNPKLSGREQFIANHPVRSKEEADEAALTNTVETADNWMKLLLGE